MDSSQGTHIRVDLQTLHHLGNSKRHPEESHNDVIRRLLNMPTRPRRKPGRKKIRK